MIEGLLAQLANAFTEATFIAPLLAFVAGILTAFLPCSLSSIPLVIGYVGATKQRNTKTAFMLSITYAIGSSITFALLAVVAVMAGRMLSFTSQWWYLFLGVLMVLMALQTWELIELVPSTYLISKSKKQGYIGAFLAGILGGFFSSPCTTPFLIALLAMLSKSNNLFMSLVVMTSYGLGSSILTILAGTSLGFVSKIKSSEQYGKMSELLQKALGLAILMIGLYMFYLGF